MGTETLDDAALAQLIDLGFDFLCTRRVSELVDVDRLLDAIDQTHTELRIGRFLERFVVPARDRLIERGKKSDIALSAWLPEPARDKIAELLGRPAPIPQKLIDEAVASEGVRDQIRDMLRDTLSNFVSKATSGGGSGGAGGALRGAIGLGARAFGAAGKAVLGGIGEEIQKQLQDRVRDFVDGAVEGIQDRIAKRLADPKTAEELGKRRRKAFLKLLERKESDAARLIHKAPHRDIDALVPSIVRHNLARAEVREALRAEIAAALAEMNKQTIGELLDEAGARALARDALQAHLLPLLREMVKTPAFVAWWDAR